MAGGSKRSSRLAARNSKPKYNEEEPNEDTEGKDPKATKSDDDGDSEFSGGGGGGGSDDASESSKPADHDISSSLPKPKATGRRRGKLGNQQKRSSETSESSDKKTTRSNPKAKAPPKKVKTLDSFFQKKEKPQQSRPKDNDNDDGSDHAEEDGPSGEDTKEPAEKGNKRKLSNSDESRESKRTKQRDADTGQPPPPDSCVSESKVDKKAGNDNKGSAAPAKILNTDDTAIEGPDDPPRLRKADVDEEGKETGGACPDSGAESEGNSDKKAASQEKAEPRTATDESEGNTSAVAPSESMTNAPRKSAAIPGEISDEKDGDPGEASQEKNDDQTVAPSESKVKAPPSSAAVGGETSEKKDGDQEMKDPPSSAAAPGEVSEKKNDDQAVKESPPSAAIPGETSEEKDADQTEKNPPPSAAIPGETLEEKDADKSGAIPEGTSEEKDADRAVKNPPSPAAIPVETSEEKDADKAGTMPGGASEEKDDDQTMKEPPPSAEISGKTSEENKGGQKIKGPPSSAVIPGGKSEEKNEETQNDTTKCNKDTFNELIMPTEPDLKDGAVLGPAEIGPAEGGNDQSTAGSENESPDVDVSAVAASEDMIDNAKRTEEFPMIKESATPSLPQNDEKSSADEVDGVKRPDTAPLAKESSAPSLPLVTLISEGESPVPREDLKGKPDDHSESIICESGSAANIEPTDPNESGHSQLDTPSKIEPDNSQKKTNLEKEPKMNATLDVVTPLKNAEKASGEECSASAGFEETRSRIVSDETTIPSSSGQTPVEMECSPTPENQAQESCLEGNVTNVSTPIQYPKTAQSPTKRQVPSVGQLKMALFLESSKVHRGSGAERIFANYWEALEKYIRLGSSPGAMRRARSDLSPSFAGIEAMLKGFLKTRKMKRLHNKLVLAIMTEAMRTDMPAPFLSHIPEQWQSVAKKSASSQLNELEHSIETSCRYRTTDLCQWDANFGPKSGMWTVCGDEIALTKTDDSISISPELVRSIDNGENVDEDILPSARLPGALDIEPMVRKHTTTSGITPSDDAIWMIVVAAREHSSSLMKKIIAYDKEFDNGYVSQLPMHNQTSLACHHLSRGNSDESAGGKPSKDEIHVKSSGDKKTGRKKVINATTLSHVLAENSSVTSRLTSMYSAARLNRGGFSSSHGLDIVNSMVNSSIQRAASGRHKSSPKSHTTSHVVPSAQLNAASTWPDANLARALQPPASFPSTATQGLGQSMLPPMPQSQPAPQSLPPQNIQRIHSSQLMSHSIHSNGNNTTEPMQISRAAMPNSEPLTKPGFPGMTNDAPKKPEMPQNSASAPTTSSPPPRSIRRGSKNLAAMIKRPSSQPKPTSDKGSTASDQKSANGASPGSTMNQKDASEEKKDDAKEKKDDATESRPSSTGPGPARPRGRFGAKNLAALRQRASATEQGK